MIDSPCPPTAPSLHDVILKAIPTTRLLYTEEQLTDGICVVICLPERLPTEAEVLAFIACIGVRVGCPETLICLFEEPIPGYDEVIIRESKDAPALDDAAVEPAIKAALVVFDSALETTLANESA